MIKFSYSKIKNSEELNQKNIRKSKIKIFLLIVGVLFFLGCEKRKYQEVDPDVWALVDMSKKGNIYETDISIIEDNYYKFDFGYIQDKETLLREIEEARRLSLELSNYITVFKILGLYGSEHAVVRAGSKIILKLTITPYQVQEEDYLYRKGDDYNLYTKFYAQKEKPFEVIMDLSKYGYISTCMANDNSGDISKNKKIVAVWLKKGMDYHIKLESLNDVLELKKIRTHLIIEPDYRSK
ncbi:hypothetical protein CRU99_13260 [Malaciobacter mytili]|uniref:DUF5625 family protein n=1 Tax=Malaciobacter mytili TaxID=603050 RepID=UPI00100BF0AA|nr:DUF5625 family protein [Malaciobacter mytili]RXI36665.1 hypothetical protein CRU99_13260 [Malaciobacter mytili]